MTFRAIATLQTVDLIASEDTRHTGKLLAHFGIATPQISYHQHNHVARIDALLGKLNAGKTIALVTDAGTPGISDPGYELVAACVDGDIEIIPIPGVSAVVTALSASGLDSSRFLFEGFLPVKPKRRQAQLENLKTEPRTLVFYEAPHRIAQTLADLYAAFGDRKITIARELTKLYEAFWRGSLSSAIANYRDYKGEITLVVSGANPNEEKTLSPEQIIQELTRLLAQGLTRSQASRALAAQCSLSRRELYQIALEIE